MTRLTDTEILVAQRVAQRRGASNRISGIKNGKLGPQSDEETDFQGVCGELVVAKHLNVYPDFSDTFGDYDLEYKGMKVEVKTTKYKSGHLEVNATKYGSGELYVLVIDSCPEFRIAGWMMKWQLIDKKNLLTPKGYSGKMYRVSQDQLIHIEWMMELA